MAIKQLTDSEAANLAGTNDAATGVPFPALNASGWAYDYLRSLQRLLDVSPSDLAVVEVDTAANHAGVLPGSCAFGDYPGGTGSTPAVTTLADDDTTYIWAESDGSNGVQINSATDATGWPTTAHIKLAEVTMASGAITQITDRRGRQHNPALAAAVADIPTPASATAEDCANTINALLAALRTAGLIAP
ncbi:MAG: hypothetical protein AAF750_15565 [Planctomycetota bacterium]